MAMPKVGDIRRCSEADAIEMWDGARWFVVNGAFPQTGLLYAGGGGRANIAYDNQYANARQSLSNADIAQLMPSLQNANHKQEPDMRLLLLK